MTKLLALAFLGVGMTSGALALAGYNPAALSRIENAGETNAGGMHVMMVLIGGGILFTNGSTMAAPGKANLTRLVASATDTKPTYSTMAAALAVAVRRTAGSDPQKSSP